MRTDIVADRKAAYPFGLITLLTWVPLTLWLLRAQWRAPEIWLGAAGFAISILWLMFIGRTFNNYYLIWPLVGAIIAALLAVAPPARASPLASDRQ